MRVELSRLVVSDLESIGDYIAQDNPARAVSFVREIRAKLRQIGSGPMHYQLRPEVGKDARIAVIGQYVVLFRVTGSVVRIERVVFGGRNLPEVLEQCLND